jgi:general secretion pathway protein F
MRRLPAPLPYRLRADLFAQLAALEQAGLPADKAFKLVQVPGEAQERLRLTRHYLAKGKDPADAGSRASLFTGEETTILRAALAAGSPAASYRRLAGRYAARAAQHARIKARSMLPMAILVAALFIAPLPELVAGRLGALAYGWHIVRPVLIIGLLALGASQLALRYHAGEPGRWRTGLEAILLQLPLFGPVHYRSNLRDFADSLAMQLEAGIALFEALPQALACINNSLLRARCGPVLDMVEHGATLADAMAALALEGQHALVEFIHTGEQSGTLPEMLFRHVDTESASIALFQDQLASWLPRFFYALVAGWMALQLLRP